MASKHKPAAKNAKEKQGKKRKLEKEDDDEDSCSSSDESESISSAGSSNASDQDNQEELNIDFEGMNITDEDFHGIKMLLQQLLVTISVNISELTQLVISQKDIGSTLKVFDDDENTVYGLTTIVDFNKNKETDCVEKFCKAIKDKCKETSKSFNAVNECFEKRICFLINERFINIPGEVAAPMLNSLRTEMKEACKEGKLSEFDYILLVSKSVKAASPKDFEANNGELGESSSSSTKLSKKERKKLKSTTNEDLQFLNHEDELFYNAASFKFSFPVTKATGFAISGKWDFGDVVMDTFRTVMIIDYSKFDKIIEEIEVTSS